MTRLLPHLALFVALTGIPQLARAEETAKDKTAEAIATPVEKRTDEQKGLVYAKIQAENRARFEKERLDNIREIATVRSEKVDLTKLLEGHLTDADGKPVSIETISKARYIAFYHSASWCCGCKEFTPQLLEAAKKYTATDVAFVFVSWDKPGEITEKYMKVSDMPGPSVPKSTFADSPARLAIRSIPHLRVYDASGSLVADSLDDRGEHRSYGDQFAALDKLCASKQPPNN